jgi:hypothetical protein
MTDHSLTPEIADRFARIALGHVAKEYPNKLDHVLTGPADAETPRALHPIFFGSFDWHSCVHGYWLLARLYRRFPDGAQAAAISALFEDAFTSAKVEAERAYLDRPSSAGFERPYGWAWLLMLAGELARHESAEGRAWSLTITPLARAFASRFTAYLPKATYPVRAGVHSNTAFALTLALDYAETVQDNALAELLRQKAVDWYAGDADCQAWEPSGDEFLSSSLIEAECMRRALGPERFAAWFARFLPRVAQGEPATLFIPATVSDRSDGKIAHLDGVNLSRAWCWRGIGGALAKDDPAHQRALQAAGPHLDASLPHVAGDYMGEHWLASFALLALEAG